MEDHTEAVAGGDGVSIHAGFPNPAAGQRNKALSLDQLLIRHPSSTYLFRLRGSAHEAHGIFDGDIAIIDRSLSPKRQSLVLYWQDDAFNVRKFSDIPPHTEPWGVISSIIHVY
jgi:DNA polymerase V